ncbi:hypothetical protein OEZ85_007851 [Tetradesmus obliquus]|uniref:FCP1 homology domain-containing protein n=1 Tax=Tetradesmus obliquus TaxID=3088 RepID=A0ABY8TH65_TETOB|nr:hypothetical protein OEZ85_007851 [Tetradesmus obliquus]
MKFGKRLAAEAARCWPEACLDYKAIKRALKHDLATGDATATTFLQQLHSELNKVSRFYVEKAEALEATLSKHTSSAAVLSSEQLSALRDEIRQLIKFVALNYLAVVKAIKKRNRHCKVTFGAAATGPALHPLDLLKQEAQLEACLLAGEELEEPDCKYLLPRPLPHHAGRLTVLLDLDGTLVSSFTPRRAPRLPPAMKSHLVGVGSSLNPGGVFVVERPGLTEFLAQLAGMSEVVVFTAGLEEYAAPIIDAIDPDNKFIAGRLYRPACTRTAHHQCIKDLHLLGRPLSRTVLVDDTPLAFLHQPANGVPVLGFRGDPDDRLLMEAVLPLLQTLAGAPDVRTVLERRFDMMNWFKRHGYPNSLWEQQHAATPAAVPAKAAAAATSAPAAVQPADAQVLVEDSMVVDDKHKERCLLVFDFDRTLTDWDAGERLVSELAPELLPWLSGLQQPTNFVPITNEVLQEMARRGVSRDKLLTQLQLLGSELPPASVKMLRWAAQQGLPVRVLSDCNQVFINHILSGAKLGGVFKDAQSKFKVITNAAAFERIAAAQAADAGIGLGVFGRRKASTAAAAAPSYRLVIQPRHPESSVPHNCPMCPENLCKGAELRRLRFGASSSQHGGQQLCSGSYGRIVYAGDGANDICPALSLGPNDVVLARAGEALAAYAAAAAQDSTMQQFAAPVFVWHTHEELAQLVREHSQAASS